MTEHKFISDIEYKQCSCCKEFKTLNQFQKRKDSKDGYRDKCTSCSNVVKQAWLNKPFEVVTHKICSKCGIDKPILEYTKSSSSVDGYSYTCKDCTKLYRQQNIESIKQREQEYRNRPETKEYHKKYYEQYKVNNPDKIKQFNQNSLRYYYENKKSILTRQNEYYNKNKEKLNQKARERYQKQSEKTKQQKEQQRLELLNQGLKICYVCKQTKHLDCFGKRKTSVDGLEPTCIECRNKQSIERKANRIIINEGFKTCSCCGKNLPIAEFKIVLSCSDGHSGQCKACEREKLKLYNNSLTPEQKEQKRQYHRDYSAKNKKQQQEYQKQYKLANAEKLKQADRERYRKNKLNKSMSSWLRTVLKENKAERHWEDLVPYNLQQVKEHLESQFTPEMNWDNYGTYWEIDHIIPQNLFHIETENDRDFQICWSLANLRPLEKTLNRQRPKDGSDIPDDIKQNILNQLE